MPYCPTHGYQHGKHCPECGAPLSESPPAAGDRIQNRSPEAHAHASANPTFVLPGGHVETRPALVKCPKCGKRNLEPATFDCQGDCGRQNLCERHFDEEFEVCIDCARILRGEVEAEAERQAKLHDDLASWRQRAEQAEAQVVELTRQGQQASKDLDQARAELRLAQERVQSLEQELAAQTRCAEQAEASTAVLAKRSQQAENDLAQSSAEASQVQTQVQMIEKDLASWRGRAEKAESQLASTERGQRGAGETTGVSPTASAALETQTVPIFEEELGGTVSPELLSILVCPEDEGPLVLSSDGKWLVNLRNGYRYPIRKGIPVLLIDEGRKYKDASLVAQNAQPILTSAIEPTSWQQIGIELVCIPAGEFLYGDEKRKVHLPEYWIAKTPVTNIQYEAFVNATRAPMPSQWTGGRIPPGKESHPVVNVTWEDAQMFCQWAGLRLPTEQEWEKAARGADGREYPWGNQAPDAQRCNFKQSVKDTTPVGNYSLGVSPYGLLDMAGNVWEWCEDWYDSEYDSYVLRGGSWSNNASYARAALRGGGKPYLRNDYVGFRCARSS